MKTPFLFLALLIQPLAAQSGAPSDTKLEAGAEPSDQAHAASPIINGDPPPEPEKLDFKIRETLVRKIIREEPAAIPNMEPVRKQVTATVNIVEDPGLTDPEPPLPALDINDPAVIARMAKLREKYRDREVLFVSATVYDHRHTLIHWYPNGAPGKKITAWSNIDFNLFCGFVEFGHKARTFSLMMGIGNESAVIQARRAAKLGIPYQPLVPPDFPSDAPGFVVVEGDVSDPASLGMMEGLHDYYREHETDLRAIYERRKKEQVAREVYFRANPPQPKDVTINFWKRDHPVETQQNNQKEDNR